jgi:hypothetical protein
MTDQAPPPAGSAAALFRWACLAVAAAALAGFGWMINDLRRELERSTRTVNENLPVILEQTKTSTATLAVLSDDIRALRDLAGATGPRDRSLVAFADSLLDAVESSGGQIGVEKLIGKDLSDPVPAAEWVVDARKEAVVLSFRAKSRRELLQRLCQNKFGSPWLIRIGDAAPQPLQEWLEQNHSEAAALTGDADQPP